MRIIIASRKSDLARIQAQNVASLLRAQDPNLEIEHEFTSSFGDQNPDIPLWQMPEKGAFTEDFREKLDQGKVDMVVHSWKDLPTELAKDSIIYTVQRADPRDLIIFKKNSIKKKNLKILTSSPRRQFHLPRFIEDFFPSDIEIVESIPVRGNIPTRLEKFYQGEADGIIVAKAAIDRILATTTDEYKIVRNDIRKIITDSLWMIPPLSHFPTAPAQGALAIEVNRHHNKINALLDKIHHQPTYDHVKRERDILRSFGGGCHQKIGVTSLPVTHGEYFSMSGESPDGEFLSELNFHQKDMAENDEWEMPTRLDEVFPITPSSDHFFKRRSLEINIESEDDLFFARYHDDTAFRKITSDQLVWCAGTSTWKKLAKNRIWCRGCNEGLGEGFEKSISLINGKSPNWTYLTHMDSTASQNKRPYYQLEEKENLPDLKGKKFFYWMSGSQFRLALKQVPSIKEGFHACGPGQTLEELKKILPTSQIKTFLNHGHWLNSLGLKSQENTKE